MGGKHKLFILVGLPASGKSTYIRDILSVEFPDAIVVSTDNHIEQYATSMNKTYNQVFSDYIKPATSLTLDDVEYAFENKKDVIWDQTNLTVDSRKKKLNMFPNYEKHCIVFETPVEYEHDRRLQSRPGKNIPYHVIKSMKNSFQEPTKDEGFDTITWCSST